MVSNIITYITTNLPRIRKAIAGGIAGATAYYTGAEVTGATVTGLEWVALILVGIGAGLLTWVTPNATS